MRRVLVPLDGTGLAASILPDARRLAGPDGELILVRDAGASVREYPIGVGTGPRGLQEVSQYLDGVAEALEKDGVTVETHALAILDPAHAIDVAAQVYRADLVACATHGRSPLGRLVRGGVAWRALLNSPVPVLLRHVDEHPLHDSVFAEPRTIMVPLDGSAYAESALPLAREMAEDWHARLVLAEVIPTLQGSNYPFAGYEVPTADYQSDVESARSYLNAAADALSLPTVRRVLKGSVTEQLVRCTREEHVTDIVLASHGRTGLSRVLLGSVADDLIHRLSLPIIVVPMAATLGSVAEQEVSVRHPQAVP